ncbi:MAG: L,D-transpeptidase family protein [Woeseiaceae bacterium]
MSLLNIRSGFVALTIAVTLLFATARSAEADEATMSVLMDSVLAGDASDAALAARAAADRGGDRLLGQLAIELEDLVRGDYATRGNRSFSDLKPFWQQARARWVAARQPAKGATLPSNILKLPSSVQTVFSIDAGQSTGWLLKRDLQGNWFVADAYYLSVGAAGVDKFRRGDRRTPLGVYWIVEELDSTRLPPRYGVRVFPIDYPNALDEHQSRKGDGIWIHGIDPDNNIRPPQDTDGCIALVNERILSLGEALSPRETPVIVARSLSWQDRPRPDAVLNEIERRLSDWRTALTAGDVDRYLSVFADDYSRFGLPPSQWRASRRAALRSNPVQSVTINELAVLLADSDSKIYVTRFRQVISRAGADPVTVLRRFYWQADAEGRFRIIAEQNG